MMVLFDWFDGYSSVRFTLLQLHSAHSCLYLLLYLSFDIYVLE